MEQVTVKHSCLQDPAIQQVTKGANSQIRVEDYNPFDKQQEQNQRGYSGGSTQPAVMQPTQDPPTYWKSGQQTQPQGKPALNTADLQVKVYDTIETFVID